MLYATDLFLIPESKHGKGMKGFVNKLTQIQWKAGLHITGTLHSTPTDAVDSRADLLPFHLLVEKIVHQAATPLTLLPNFHQMAKHVHRAAGRYIKWHREPVHEVLHAFDTQLDDYETIKPVRCDSKWEFRLKMYIPGSREAAVVEAKVI